MSFGFAGFRSDDAGRGGVLPVMCEHCGTDSHLIIRSVTDPPEHETGVVIVAYTRARCGRFSEHPARVLDLSLVMGRGIRKAKILIFCWHYMHCGRIMKKTGSELHRLSAPPATEVGAQLLDVYIPTLILTCSCGFRLELPE
ncbi:UNVERIFIED_ORG: hypothetical protein J2X79_004498 [Arthrobacter globiformis]|nr:hypothetical protein [Arthrobacter globiformis]